MAQNIQFGVLGTLRMTVDATTHTPRGPKLRKLLALLLLLANQAVEVDTLVDELWAEDPPRWALSTVRTHIYHLRQLLHQHLGTAGEDIVVTQPSGYLLVLDHDQVDATRFTTLAQEGHRLLRQGRPAAALASAHAGLELWQGRALANVSTGRLLTGHVQRLEELRIQALNVRIEATMSLGRHRELVPELRDLVARYPLNEWFHTCLIEALRRSGRRGDALGAFHQLRTTLDDELGIAPSAKLRDLQRSILIEEGTGDATRHPDLAGFIQ
jgi:DNA-binding SARP family transcriptional activator